MAASSSASFLDDPGTEAKIREGCSGQSATQSFEQPSLVKMGKFLEQYRVIDHHFQHTAPYHFDARMGSDVRAGNLYPHLFELQSSLTSAPTA